MSWVAAYSDWVLFGWSNPVDIWPLFFAGRRQAKRPVRLIGSECMGPINQKELSLYDSSRTLRRQTLLHERTDNECWKQLFSLVVLTKPLSENDWWCYKGSTLFKCKWVNASCHRLSLLSLLEPYTVAAVVCWSSAYVIGDASLIETLMRFIDLSNTLPLAVKRRK